MKTLHWTDSEFDRTYFLFGTAFLLNIYTETRRVEMNCGGSGTNRWEHVFMILILIYIFIIKKLSSHSKLDEIHHLTVTVQFSHSTSFNQSLRQTNFFTLFGLRDARSLFTVQTRCAEKSYMVYTLCSEKTPTYVYRWRSHYY